jgi:hemolysin III
MRGVQGISSTGPASDVVVARTKPLLRGVVHQVSFFLTLPIVWWLAQTTPPGLPRLSALIYGVSLLLLLGTSAVYHRRTWGPVGRARMKSLDHSMIFVLISGTYTPICLYGVGGERGPILCLVLWAGALLGIAQTLFWPTAPRPLHVGIYVALGWAGAAGLPAEAARMGLLAVGLHVLGGVLYTLGALAYARKRPDPFPTVFGYHEIFHVLVVLACGCLFEVVRRSLLLAS